MIQSHVTEIVEIVKAYGLSEDVVRALREKFDDYHFTYCMEDDMDARTPAIEEEGFNIYYVSSADHCSKLTSDATQASGLVLAEVIV